MTAFQFLYSDHDRHVNAVRRFSFGDFRKIIDQIDGVEIVNSHYFYISLFLVRLFQKIMRVKIDPQQKVTTGWNYRRNSFLTKLSTAILNADYAICKAFASFGIRLPGLSLMVICRKSS